MTDKQFEKVLNKIVKVQKAYRINEYVISPLLKPNDVNVFYFRNKNGKFLGDLLPYFSINGNVSFDRINYWKEWEIQFGDNINIIDLDTSNHMMLLSEPKSLNLILKFLKNLYSKTGITNAFIQTFKQQMEETILISNT